jgi:uncharacterized protein DUF6526
MAEKVPQNFSNHTRFDPPYHFFILPVFAITLIITIVNLVGHPGLHSAWVVVFMLALSALVLRTRSYAVKVQDRVVRLEERLRLSFLLDEPLRARMGEFSESQLIGLRFASDAELPALAARALSETFESRHQEGDRSVEAGSLESVSRLPVENRRGWFSDLE